MQNIVGTVSLTNGADTFNNYSGGAWFVRDGVTNAGVFGLGNDTLNNNAGGHINAGNVLAAATSTFTGLENINNGGVFRAGLFDGPLVTSISADAGAAQLVTNSGAFDVFGRLSFTGEAGSSMTSTAVGVVNMQTAGNVTTDRTTLNVAITGGGATQLSNTYAPGAAYNWLAAAAWRSTPSSAPRPPWAAASRRIAC